MSIERLESLAVKISGQKRKNREIEQEVWKTLAVLNKEDEIRRQRVRELVAKIAVLEYKCESANKSWEIYSKENWALMDKNKKLMGNAHLL